MKRNITFVLQVSSVALIGSAGPALSQEGGVTFEDVVPALGVAYERVPSSTLARAEAFFEESLTTPKTNPDRVEYPAKARGAPGIALLDYDRDGDLDIYATNGPGAANTLLSNQLEESGSLDFIDVASSSGADATDQDSTGVCFGDIDNDGDHDLLVLGRNEANRLFENDGQGSFVDITVAAGVDGGGLGSSSCAFGDVNGDGLLDLFVGNAIDFRSVAAVLFEPFALNQPNQLFLNEGSNAFTDVSETAGVRDLVGVPEDTNDLTWAVSMVDYDQDGDIDIVTASEQGGVPTTEFGGVDRGFIRIFQNDGKGNFADATGDTGLLASPGAWMGLAFADLNHDGTLDIFGSNIGNYMGARYTIDYLTSRHFLQDPDGTFADTGSQPGLASVFGWGNASFDYDNDGDSDIVYFGGMDMGFLVDGSNPGVILQNDGSAVFSYDGNALTGPFSAEHSRRNEQGLAVGDLNRDGFVDIVSISSHEAPEPVPFATYSTLAPVPFPSPFNDVAGFVPVMRETSQGSGEFIWNGPDSATANGSLAIEINSGDNGNRAASVELFGTAGLTTGGNVNRDAIGAVVSFKPNRQPAALKPVLGGSSYASQHSLTLNFGLGQASSGKLDILWPGGVRNQLDGVRSSEHIRFPEIPCSYDDTTLRRQDYEACVGRALHELHEAGAINHSLKLRLRRSAMAAFDQSQ